jgi:hypothetical protein
VAEGFGRVSRIRGPRTSPEDYPVGYGKAPVHSRFKTGQSGNPRGRPRGKRTTAPYEAVLGQLVTIREDGEHRRVEAAEAFLLRLTKSGLAGDASAIRTALPAFETARMAQVEEEDGPQRIVIVPVSPETANSELRALRMAVKLDRFRRTARMRLEPWLVEAALARLGDRRLSETEQAIVWGATRAPHKVNWPDWWTEIGSNSR